MQIVCLQHELHSSVISTPRYLKIRLVRNTSLMSLLQNNSCLIIGGWIGWLEAHLYLRQHHHHQHEANAVGNFKLKDLNIVQCQEQTSWCDNCFIDFTAHINGHILFFLQKSNALLKLYTVHTNTLHVVNKYMLFS